MKSPSLLWQVNIANDQDLFYVRQCTRQLSIWAQLPVLEQTKFVTAVTEIARNALKHASGGEAIFSLLEKEGLWHLEVCVQDKGPGIISLAEALKTKVDSFVSKIKTDPVIFSGQGIAGAKNLVDNFGIDSSNIGTTVRLEKRLSADIRLSQNDLDRWNSELKTLTHISAIEKLHSQDEQLIQALIEVNQRGDILRQQQILLDERTEELERAHKFKATLVAHMSHEVRTLLNAILGTSGALSKADLTEEQKFLVLSLESAGHSLLSLVNDVLDFSRLEANKLELNEITFDLTTAIKNAINLVKVQSWGKQIEIMLFCGPFLPRSVRGDPYRVQQILSNLVVNAFKFSADQREIAVFVYNRKLCDNSTEVRFIVVDMGIGIAKKDLGRLFESFTQFNGSSAQDYGGTGLGLSISRYLVGLMQGSIGVFSYPGTGSAFWFNIPFEHEVGNSPGFRTDLQKLEVILASTDCLLWELLLEALEIRFSKVSSSKEVKELVTTNKLVVIDNELLVLTKPSQMFNQFMEAANLPYRVGKFEVTDTDEALSRQSDCFARLNQAEVLLIEDDPISLLISASQLEEFGLKVTTCSNGQQALENIATKKYSLIFTDYQLPDIKGDELTKMIRQYEQQFEYHVPIIAITGNTSNVAREKCLAAGMDDYLTKPVKKNILYDACQKWLPVSYRKIINEKFFTKFTPDQQHKLGEMFKLESDSILMKLDQYFRIRDKNSMAVLVHTLKGSSRIIYAHPIANACEDIEKALDSDNWEAIGQASNDLRNKLIEAVAQLQELHKSERIDQNCKI